MEKSQEATGGQPQNNVIHQVPQRKQHGFCYHFHHVNFFLFFLVCFVLCHGICGGITMASAGPLEREFGFTSTQIGLMSTMNDVGGLVVVIFVSYYGQKSRKPIWVGFAAILSGVANLMMALPKGMHGEYVPPQSSFNPMNLMCLSGPPPGAPPGAGPPGGGMPPFGGAPKGECWAQEQAAKMIVGGSDPTTRFSQSSYLAVLCIAQFLVGVAIIPAQTLGFTYIDENVPQKHAPIYMGILLVSSFIGTPFGLFTASNVLVKWVDPYAAAKHAKMMPFDPRFVGRWWITYAAAFPFFFIIGCILLTFPKQAHGAKALREKEKKEGNIREESPYAQYTSLKNFAYSLLAVVKNPTLVCLCLGISAYTIAISGTAPFFTKIVIQKFGATFPQAGKLLGGVSIVAMLFGLMGGAIFIKMIAIRKSINIASIICMVMAIMVVLFSCVFLSPGCKNLNIVKESKTLTCDNSKCKCNPDWWWPTCDHFTHKTYFNPCYAGCKLPPFGTPPDPISRKPNGTACTCNGKKADMRASMCDKNCRNLSGFGAGFFFLLLVGFSSATPHKMAVLRSVPHDQRALAVGLQFLCLKLFSSIPGPVIAGHIIDSSCVVWNRQCQAVGGGKWAKVRTNCVEYNTDKLSQNIVIMFAATSSVAAVIYLISFFTSRKLMNEMGEVKSITGAKDNKVEVSDMN